MTFGIEREAGLAIGIAIPAVPPFEDLVRGLSLAIELGLDAVTVSDHVVEFSLTGEGDTSAFEAQTILGALAATAGSVRLGVGVTDVLRRHPIIVGQALLTLSHLTDRPPILGLGAGESLNTTPFGMASDRPVERLEESLRLLTSWFHGEPHADAFGRGFRIHGARLDLSAPKERRPSIWIGAHGPRMLRLAGRFGDGWYPADIVDPRDYATRLEVVRRSAAEAGRDPQTIVPAGEFVVFAAPSDEEAEARLELPDAKLNGLLLPETVWLERGLRHPLGDGFRGFVDYLPRKSNLDAAELVPPELIAESTLWGAPDTIARRVSALCDVGLRHINLAFGPITERIIEEGLVPIVVESIRAATRSTA